MIKGCDNIDIEMHHIQKLQRSVSGYIVKSIMSTKNKRKHKPIKGLKLIESALRRKQIPLCSYHHQEIHKGNISLEELDLKYVNQDVKILGGKNKIEIRR